MIPPWKNERVKLVAARPEIKASIEVVLSVFMVIFLLTLAVRPTLTIVATLQKKIEDQDSVDRKLSNKITQLIKANEDLSTYSDRLSLFNLAVTDKHDQAGLAKRVEILAAGEGLLINTFTLEAVPLLGQNINLGDKSRGAIKPSLEAGTKISLFEISFDLRGKQEPLFNFLNKLENLDRVVILKNVEFKREQEKTETGATSDTIRMTGKATAYYLL